MKPEEMYQRSYWLGYINAALLATLGMYFSALYWACLTLANKTLLDAKVDLGNNRDWMKWCIAAGCVGLISLGVIPAMIFDYIVVRPMLNP